MINPNKPPGPPKEPVNNIKGRSDAQWHTTNEILAEIPRELDDLFHQYGVTSLRLKETSYLIGCGCTDEEIAKRLSIGLRSVRVYISRIIGVWGVPREELYEFLESYLMPQAQRDVDHFNNQESDS